MVGRGQDHQSKGDDPEWTTKSFAFWHSRVACGRVPTIGDCCMLPGSSHQTGSRCSSSTSAPCPFFNEDLEAAGDPEAVRHFKEAIIRANAILIATPEYNGAVPGVLANAIDWASRPTGRSVLRNKPVA